MKSLKMILIITTAVAACSMASAQYSKYDFWDNNYTVQALLGAVKYDDLVFQAQDGENVEIDLSTLPQLGGAWTTLPAEPGRFELGLECSFLLGFRFDKVNYLQAGGSGLYVSLSMSMWMFDLAGGGYANLYLDEGRKVRLYAGAGPLMNYAYYSTERDFDDTTPNVSTTESVFGLGVYARTGIEFRIHRYGMLGVGARGTWSNVDFSEFSSNSDLVGIAAFASYTAGF